MRIYKRENIRPFKETLTQKKTESCSEIQTSKKGCKEAEATELATKTKERNMF